MSSSTPASTAPSAPDAPAQARRRQSDNTLSNTLPPATKRGPHAARGEMKERILTAARAEFIAQGYDATTLRSIAATAGCDNAMVSYYFGSKQKLFRAALRLPMDPAEEIFTLLAPGYDGAAQRIINYGLDLYESRLTADTMVALMQMLMTDATTSHRFRTYFHDDIIGKVKQVVDADSDFERRLELTIASMFGVVTMRYIVRLEPLASMTRQEFIDYLLPLIQPHIDEIYLGMAKGSHTGSNRT